MLGSWCMTIRLLNKKIKELEERVHVLERQKNAPLRRPRKKTNKTELLKALRGVHGMWKDNPRTDADQKRVRRRLGDY